MYLKEQGPEGLSLKHDLLYGVKDGMGSYLTFLNLKFLNKMEKMKASSWDLCENELKCKVTKRH